MSAPAPLVATTAADLRLTTLGAAAWLGALAGLTLPWWVAVPTALGTVGLVLLGARRGWPVHTGLGVALVFLAVATSGALRAHQLATNPIAELGRSATSVTALVTVTSDPKLRTGSFSDYVVFRGRVREVTTRPGGSVRLGAPVLVLADPEWASVELGSTVRVAGRLSEPRDDDVSAVLHPRSDVDVVAAPAPWWRGAAGIRASLRASVSGVPEPHRDLVPALVVGDDAGLDPRLAADFTTTGLTHLLAVSGTNLTLLLGFVLVVGRWAGVRGRWCYLLAAVGVVGFVVLARPEPSVLRAAVMGSVGLVGLGVDGVRRGARTLGVAVTGLLLVDPWLAISPGFALSVLATGGIVFLAPVWRDALATWLPRWLAEAVAVPAAAQLACVPVVAALSGEVSLVAVLANLLAAPAVGPATVLGLAGGLVGLPVPVLGRVLGEVAGWCVWWIALVAGQGAALTVPAVPWQADVRGLGLLVVLCLVAVPLAPRMLRRRWLSLAATAVLVIAVVVGPPDPGWPPRGWVVAACDVGQGDALVLNAGGGRAVVVDVGPEPRTVGRCLDRLAVSTVPLLVLTHLHADHVGGLAGVLGEWPVGQVLVSPLADPPDSAAQVADLAAAAGAPVSPAAYGSVLQVGEVTLQVLWPPPDQSTSGPGDGSTANDASVVLLARIRGVDLLLTGDIEPSAQAALARLVPDLEVDVLKVPHHGSSHQDLPFLTSLDASIALVSVGEDNTYGHPSAGVLAGLDDAGARVLRTDRSGDLAVVAREDDVLTATR